MIVGLVLLERLQWRSGAFALIVIMGSLLPERQ